MPQKGLLNTDDLDAINARLEIMDSRIATLENAPQPEPPMPEPPPVDPEDPEDPPVDPPVVVPSGTVLIERQFDTNAEVKAFHWVDSMIYPATDEKAAYYDDAIGGAVVPMFPGEALSSLRKDSAWVLAPTTGRVYCQYDFYVPDSYYNQPWEKLKWDSMKSFRLYNANKREVRNDTAGTLTLIPPSRNMWLRHCGVFEGGQQEIRLDWSPEPNQWYTFRIVYDYDALTVEFVAMRAGQVVIEKSAKMVSIMPVDNFAVTHHSTSRSHSSKEEKLLEHHTFLAYRRMTMGVE